MRTRVISLATATMLLACPDLAWAQPGPFGKPFPRFYSPPSDMAPTAPWVFRGAFGGSIPDILGAHLARLITISVERTINQRYGVRIQTQSETGSYDPAANGLGVTSSHQFGLGVALIKTVQPIALAHTYVGIGAEFLLMRFKGISPPEVDRNRGYFGLVGLEFHPASRRWGAFLEVSLQLRGKTVRFASNDVFTGHISGSFGVTVPLSRQT